MRTNTLQRWSLIFWYQTSASFSFSILVTCITHPGCFFPPDQPTTCKSLNIARTGRFVSVTISPITWGIPIKKIMRTPDQNNRQNGGRLTSFSQPMPISKTFWYKVSRFPVLECDNWVLVGLRIRNFVKLFSCCPFMRIKFLCNNFGPKIRLLDKPSGVLVLSLAEFCARGCGYTSPFSLG